MENQYLLWLLLSIYKVALGIMRVRIHILDTDGAKISEWEISEHVADFSLQDIIVVGGKRFEIVNRRPSLIGDPWGPYDRVLIVFPLDSDSD